MKFIPIYLLIIIVFGYGWYLTDDNYLKWSCVLAGSLISGMIYLNNLED